MEAAFEAAKAALCRVMSLAHQDPSAAISLACDALDSHVGAVLQQWSPKGWRPLFFHSKKLNVTQKKYSTFGRELLAVYLAVRHFRFLLEGRQFHVKMDHKPLTFALQRTSEPWSARQQRHLSYLAEFTIDIRQVSGQRNVVADTLSRPLTGSVKVPSGLPPAQGHRLPPAPVTISSEPASLAAVTQPQEARLSLAEMASSEGSCQEARDTMQSSCLQLVQVKHGTGQMWCDVLRGAPQPLVPLTFRKAVLVALHY
jgi:hypothetical protein